MKIACDYCDQTIPSKNKKFCDKECMANYMRMQECHNCLEKYEPEEGYDFFCSKKCFEIQNIKQNINSLETHLGYGFFGVMPRHELVELKCKFRNVETGEVIEKRIGSLKEEMDSYIKINTSSL